MTAKDPYLVFRMRSGRDVETATMDIGIAEAIMDTLGTRRKGGVVRVPMNHGGVTVIDLGRVEAIEMMWEHS